MSTRRLMLSLPWLLIVAAPVHAAPRVEIVSQTRQITWAAHAEDAQGSIDKRIARSGSNTATWTPASDTMRESLVIPPRPTDEQEVIVPLITGATIAWYRSSNTTRSLTAASFCEVNLTVEDPATGSGVTRCENRYQVQFHLSGLSFVQLSGTLTSNGVAGGIISLRTTAGEILAETSSGNETLGYAANLPPGDYVFQVDLTAVATIPLEQPPADSVFRAGTGSVNATLNFH